MKFLSSIRRLYCFGGVLSQSFLVATVYALNQGCAWGDDEMEMIFPFDSDNNASIEKSSGDALNHCSAFVSKQRVAICLNDSSYRDPSRDTLD